MMDSKSLRICLLSYRSNPYCGGQGVYIRHLSRALTDLGHSVEVLAGNPPPRLDDDIKLTMVSGLDLYSPENAGMPSYQKLWDPLNFTEWFINATMGYPEPFIFGVKANRYLANRLNDFHIIHDNQSLSYGLLQISKRIPTVATIHHPMTRDRDIAVGTTRSFLKKAKHMRWYSFIGMQKTVVRKLSDIITVSECSKQDIIEDFSIPSDTISVIPNGIDTGTFYPVSGIRREKNRIIVTNSADSPLKGLYYLIHAVHDISMHRDVFLTVIGTPKTGGVIERLIDELGLESVVSFTGRVTDDEFVHHYARATVAVIPSLYEGFGLPVGEAMACGLPVITTTGGALPEVAGNAAIQVPPGDKDALAQAICDIFDNPEKADRLGAAGYKRVHDSFSWKQAAEMTVETYRTAISRFNS